MAALPARVIGWITKRLLALSQSIDCGRPHDLTDTSATDRAWTAQVGGRTVTQNSRAGPELQARRIILPPQKRWRGAERRVNSPINPAFCFVPSQVPATALIDVCQAVDQPGPPSHSLPRTIRCCCCRLAGNTDGGEESERRR